MKKHILLCGLILISIALSICIFLSLNPAPFMQIAIFPAESDEIFYFKIDPQCTVKMQHGKSTGIAVSDDSICDIDYEKKIELSDLETDVIRSAEKVLKDIPDSPNYKIVVRDGSVIQILYKDIFFTYYLTEVTAPKEIYEMAQFLIQQ